MNDEIKVYIKLNENNIITEINSSIFLSDISDYIEIDSGYGDKYAHAQGNYLEKGLIDDQCNYNYKYVDGSIVELTTEEKETLFNKDIEDEITEKDMILNMEKTIYDSYMND